LKSQKVHNDFLLFFFCLGWKESYVDFSTKKKKEEKKNLFKNRAVATAGGGTQTNNDFTTKSH
jgi:hypothetical protein